MIYTVIRMLVRALASHCFVKGRAAGGYTGGDVRTQQQMMMGWDKMLRPGERIIASGRARHLARAKRRVPLFKARH